MIFKHKFQCRELPPVFYTSFEVQLLELNCAPLILWAVVYRPPKFVKDFILQFTDLPGSLFLRYDHALIVGDFNINVCCEANTQAKDFLTLIDTFYLTQWVSEPTHSKGHSPDLVLSYVLDIHIRDIKDSGISFFGYV